MKEETLKRVKRILEVIRDIPPGRVAGYGHVAEIAGVPRGARQVSFALRHVPDDQPVPWHRVLKSDGKIAFAQDSTHFKKQRDKLRDEGVVVRNGAVDMRKFRWQPDLDELLWKPSDVWDEDL